MAKSRLKLVTPATVNRTVTPKRLPNGKLRTREYLTEAEVSRLMGVAKTTATATGTPPWSLWLIGTAYGPPSWWTCAGLRWASERPPCTSVGLSRAPPAPILSWATSCGRCAGSIASRSRSRPSCLRQSGARRSRRPASLAWSRAGSEAKLGFKPHPHMLHHACGYALANKGHDTRALQAYLGHRNIQHTVRYTELSPTRFKDFWRG